MREYVRMCFMLTRRERVTGWVLDVIVVVVVSCMSCAACELCLAFTRLEFVRVFFFTLARYPESISRINKNTSGAGLASWRFETRQVPKHIILPMIICIGDDENVMMQFYY